MAFAQGQRLENPPPTVVLYILCEKFGWKPDEVWEQDHRVVQDFLALMQAESHVQDAKMKEMEAKARAARRR